MAIYICTYIVYNLCTKFLSKQQNPDQCFKSQILQENKRTFTYFRNNIEQHFNIFETQIVGDQSLHSWKEGYISAQNAF